MYQLVVVLLLVLLLLLLLSSATLHGHTMWKEGKLGGMWKRKMKKKRKRKQYQEEDDEQRKRNPGTELMVSSSGPHGYHGMPLACYGIGPDDPRMITTDLIP